MSDEMYDCPKCGSNHIALPIENDRYPASAKEAWGECLDCGATLGPPDSEPDEMMVEVDENGKMIDIVPKNAADYKAEYDASIREKPVGSKGMSPNDIRKLQDLDALALLSGGAKERPFGELTRREFDEIVVALELLLEHPATGPFLKPMMLELREEATRRSVKK